VEDGGRGGGRRVQGVEDWVLGVDDGLGVEDYERAWAGTGCGVLGDEYGSLRVCGWVCLRVSVCGCGLEDDGRK